MAAGVACADFAPLLGGEGVVVQAQDVHLDPRRDQGHDGALVLGDAGGGVQGDGVPHILDVAFGELVGPHEVGGGVGAVDLEAFVGAGEGRLEAHVVEHGAQVEQLEVDLQALALSGEGAEQEDPVGVMVEQLRFGVPHQLVNVAGQGAVGHGDTRDGSGGDGSGGDSRSHDMAPVCEGERQREATAATGSCF